MEVVHHGLDRFSANTTDHELPVLVCRNQARQSQLFDVKGNGRTKLIASRDMATDLADGGTLHRVNIPGFFHRHRATSFAKKLEDGSPGGIAECPEHRGQVLLTHG